MLPERCAGCEHLVIAHGAIDITEYSAGCSFFQRSLYRINDQRRCKNKKLIRVQKSTGDTP